MLFEKSLTPESNSEKKGKSKGWRMGAPIPKSKGGEQMGAIRWGKSCKKYSLASGNAPYSRDNPEKTDGGVREYMAVI